MSSPVARRGTSWRGVVHEGGRLGGHSVRLHLAPWELDDGVGAACLLRYCFFNASAQLALPCKCAHLCKFLMALLRAGLRQAATPFGAQRCGGYGGGEGREHLCGKRVDLTTF